MNRNEIEHKIGIVEKVGEIVGKAFGLIIKSPFRFIGFMFGFLTVAFIAFVYSMGAGIKKS